MKPGRAILPLEVWADIFLSPYQWINRHELAEFYNNIKNRGFANKLEKLIHDCGQHTLHKLEIISKSEYSIKPEECKYQLRKRKIPYCRALLQVIYGFEPGNCLIRRCGLPETQMPTNIKNIKQLTIKYLDDDVLDFLNKLKPLFTNVHLYIQEYSPENLRILLAHLFPMLGGIRRIESPRDCTAGLLDQHFPGEMARAKELELSDAEPTSISAYLNWLNSPQDFGLDGPRFLKIGGRFATATTIFAILGAVRKQFMEATTPATFVVYLQFSLYEEAIHRVEELTIENAATKEELSIRNAIFERRDFHYVEILRYPSGAKANMQEWVKRRAYYDKWCDNQHDGAEQLICIIRLKLGHITKAKKKKIGAVNQSEDGDQSESAGEEDQAGPSTSEQKK